MKPIPADLGGGDPVVNKLLVIIGWYIILYNYLGLDVIGW
jgi:hypothetical protein